MKLPLTRFLLILLVLAAASLACNLPAGFPSQEPTLPPTVPPLNPEQQQQLQDQLKATLEGTTNGEVTVTITQQQLNAYISAEAASQEEPWITDPSVVLTNGQVEVYGKIAQGGISANTKIVMKPRIDAEGTPKLDVVSITLGSLPVPDALSQRISSLVDNTLSDYLAQGGDQFKVNDITITEGQMTVSGVRKQP
jgi:uncharacterized protein YpmS